MGMSNKALRFLEELKKGKKLGFRDQEIFNNQRSFNIVVRRLLQAKLILNNWDNGDKYELTVRGVEFVNRIQAYNKY